jgi:uncharacterized protein YciI
MTREELESALVAIFDAAIPQAMPWTRSQAEKAEYAAKTLPHHVAGLNRMLASRAAKIEEAVGLMGEAEAELKSFNSDMAKKLADWLRCAGRVREAADRETTSTLAACGPLVPRTSVNRTSAPTGMATP